MKSLLFMLWLFWIANPVEIARINKIKDEAEKAYQNKNYELAASKYKLLSDSLGVNEDEILLNLGHSYYQLKDTLHAKNSYSQLTSTSNKQIKSVALQQLGVMAREKMALEESLQYLKSSLKANPMNEQSRYDYEVVKKLLDQQKEQNQDQNKDQNDQDQNQDENKENQEQQDQDQQQQDKENQEKSDEQKEQEQQQKDQENKEGEEPDDMPQDGEEEEKEEQEQKSGTKEKLEEMNISEEKAQMILEAMKNNEFQYIQQRKRKPTKPQDSGKPDW